MAGWTASIRKLVEELRALDLGYPQGENRVGEPVDMARLEPFERILSEHETRFVRELYSCVGQVELSDVHNGLFIDPPERLLERLMKASPLEPRRLSSDRDSSILCFGSDGGGGRFACLHTKLGDCIAYLPIAPVYGSAFDDTTVQPSPLARTVAEFGDQLARHVGAFIEGAPNWRYWDDEGTRPMGAVKITRNTEGS